MSVVPSAASAATPTVAAAAHDHPAPDAKIGIAAPSVASTALRHSRALNVGTFHAPTERIVESARLIKDAAEIAALREGGRRLARVAEQVPAMIRKARSPCGMIWV